MKTYRCDSGHIFTDDFVGTKTKQVAIRTMDKTDRIWVTDVTPEEIPCCPECDSEIIEEV
tara:strand:+ start:457 stop:636 length:180 start_codon:yes stop_codon:yes gene_type:complete